jgi:hypothetical protein
VGSAVIGGIRIKWDDDKSALLKVKRGLSFEEVLCIYRQDFWGGKIDDLPSQHAMISWVGGSLITLIYEDKQDDEGDYDLLRTYWKTTNQEMKKYGIQKK